MMHEGYKNYLDVLASKGMGNPMSEKDWKAGVGIKDEEEHIPFVARKKESFRNVIPTLSNHEDPKASTPLKVNLMDRIPAPSKTIEKPIPKKTKAIPVQKEITRRANAIPKTSLQGMNKKERQEHRNKLARERRAKDKKNGELKPMSEERKKKQRKYCNEYYKNNKEKILEAARIRRENRTPEEREAAKKYMSQWQEDNRERVNANARDWKKKNRQPQNNTSISQEKSLSA